MLANEDMLERLGSWLAVIHPAAQGLACSFIGTPKTGMSNDTRFVRAIWNEGGNRQEQRYVLRCGVAAEPVHPLQTDAVASSVALQYRVMAALLADGAIPVAAVTPLESDSRWLGAPFFLMQFVEGETLSDFPSFTESGPVVEAAAGARRAMVHNGLATLARLHGIDWRKAGLSWLDRGTGEGPRLPAQLDLWDQYAAPIFKERAFPVLGDALAWLRRHLPEEPPATLVWGDARPQNILWGKTFGVRSVMDWEGAAILPPEADIAYWLINDCMVHERVGAARLEGYPTRAEQLSFYADELGRPVRDIKYYEIFGMMTIVATMYNVYSTLRDKGVTGVPDSDPEDNYFSRELRRQMNTAKSVSMESDI